MASFHAFDATNDPGTCLWCGRKLRRPHNTTTERVPRAKPKRSTCCDAEVYYEELRNWYYCTSCDESVASGTMERVISRTPRYDKPGDYGDGFFCGLRCGYQFGERHAQLGARLVRKASP